MTSDARRTLGLKPGCSSSEVTKAFRRLARTRHPDKGGSKEDFQRLRAAYELLSKGDQEEPQAAEAKEAKGPPNPFAKMWAEAQRINLQERAARKAQAARRASMSGAEKCREEINGIDFRCL